MVHHIGAFEQDADGGAEALVLQVHGHRLLPRLRAEERPFHPAQRISGHRLDLDHVRAQIGEQTGRVRTGEPRAEVDDAHARQQRPAVGRLPSVRRCPLRRGKPHVRAVLAGRRRRPAHRRGRGRERGWRRYLLDRPEHWVVHRDHHLVVDDLRLIEDVGDGQVLHGADIDVTEPAFPGVTGSTAKDLRQVGFEDVLLVVGEWHPEIEPVRAGGDPIIETEERHEAAERADGPGVHPEIGPVAAQERAGDKAVLSR